MILSNEVFLCLLFSLTKSENGYIRLVNDQVIDYFQPDYGGKKKKGTTLGIVGMSLAILGIISSVFTSGIYFEFGWPTALAPGIISIAGLALSITGKIISSGLGVGNGYGLTGIIVAPFGIVIFVVMFGLAYNVEVILKDLGQSMHDGSWDKPAEIEEEEKGW